MSVGILLPSVQLWLNLNFYCSFITKLLVDTIRMITGMDVAYHFFITPVMKVSVLQLWTTREMDSCLVIATKCWFSRGFLPTQGWNRQKVSGNCCEKHLKAIIPGSRLSNTHFTLTKGSLLPVPPTSDFWWKMKTSSWKGQFSALFLHRGLYLGCSTVSFLRCSYHLLLLSPLCIARRNTVNPGFSLYSKRIA